MGGLFYLYGVIDRGLAELRGRGQLRPVLLGPSHHRFGVEALLSDLSMTRRRSVPVVAPQTPMTEYRCSDKASRKHSAFTGHGAIAPLPAQTSKSRKTLLGFSRPEPGSRTHLYLSSL